MSIMAGIILAGGAARRMGGRNKALLEIAGQPVLQRILTVMERVCREILLVVKDPQAFGPWTGRVQIVLDGEQRCSPAIGLRCGLLASTTDYNLVVGADLPFLDGPWIEWLGRQAAGYDAAVPRWQGLPEPLCAVYHRRCLGPLEEQLAGGEQALWKLLPRLNVNYLDDRSALPPRSIFNINRPEDLEKAARMAGDVV